MKNTNKIKEELSKAYFGEETRTYDYRRSKDQRRKYILERKNKIIGKFLHSSRGKNILDVACGTGRFFHLYKKRNIYGIDISKDQLSEAGKKDKNAILKICDAEKICYPDNYFDVVITSQFIEHIPQYNRVIHEMVRVCKPGGILIIDFPNKFSLTYLPTKIRIFFKRLRWLNLFSRNEIKKIAKELDLEIVDWDYTVIITPNIFPDSWTSFIKIINRLLYKIIPNVGYLHYVKFKKRR
jgi:ubiquinone/menaquinone biosynthesis C-methylase UbiE